MSDVYADMPKSLRIGFSTYEVNVVDENVGEIGDFLGASQNVKQIITICEGMSAQQVVNTFIHEVVHCIHSIYGLMNRDPKDILEEEWTNLAANGLCAFFQDNPDALKWIQAYVK